MLATVREARAALERVLEVRGWPEDLALSRALDRLGQLEERAIRREQERAA